MSTKTIGWMGVVAGLWLGGCGVTATTDGGPPASRDASSGGDAQASAGPVYELAIRRLNAGQDVAVFERARDAFVARLRTQSGVSSDREFRAVFDFGTNAPPSPEVFTGMTQYASLASYEAASAALGNSTEAGAFFTTFTPIAFTVLRPLDPRATVDLSTIASGSGQVIEIAPRNLGNYPSFDQEAYATSRDAFLAVLRAQPGVLAEYQWVSALDPNLVVGMTVYQDGSVPQRIATDPAFTSNPAVTSFFTNYPPSAGFIHSVVR